MPSDGWHIHEPCAGSAALTYHLFGAKRSILPYMGSKWRYRRELEKLVRAFGFSGKPDAACLTDVGPWGQAHICLSRERTDVLDSLRGMAQLDARSVYGRILEEGIYSEEDGSELCNAEFTARFLFLQRLAFSGKAVGTKGPRNRQWLSPGFNGTSAYGCLPRWQCTHCEHRFLAEPEELVVCPKECAGRGRQVFGRVKPMIPSLIRAIEALPRRVVRFAEEMPLGPHSLVYIDPPYVGSTPYPNGTMPRYGVIALARSAAEQGAAVIVSEAEAIPELVADGWGTLKLAGRGGDSPFKTTKEEWLTFMPPRR